MFRALHNSLFRIVLFVALCTTASCANLSREYVTIEGQALGTFVVIKYGGNASEQAVVDMVKKIDQEAKSSMSSSTVFLSVFITKNGRMLDKNAHG